MSLPCFLLPARQGGIAYLKGGDADDTARGVTSLLPTIRRRLLFAPLRFLAIGLRFLTLYPRPKMVLMLFQQSRVRLLELDFCASFRDQASHKILPNPSPVYTQKSTMRLAHA